MKKIASILSLILLVTTPQVFGRLIISQYYEGNVGSNKWIEIANGTEDNINLDNEEYYLGLWANQNAEGYKNDVDPTYSIALKGSLSSGSTLLLSHTSSDTPLYASANMTSGSVGNFNGNDSLVLYYGSTFATANVVDAIGFTDSGKEGANTSFVRISTEPGWNTTDGSQAREFASIWSEVSLDTVNNAGTGSNEQLGSTTLAVVPEPALYAFAFAALSMTLVFCQHRRRIRAMPPPLTKPWFHKR